MGDFRTMRHFPFLFLLLAALHLYAEWSYNESLILATKPLLLFILAIWALFRLWPIRTRLSRLLVIALLFSLTGDVFLMLVSYGPKIESFFLTGLGCFFGAQVSYAGAFLSFPDSRNGHVFQSPLSGWPFLIYLAAIVGTLWPGLGDDLRLPVIIYAVSITGMALSALNLRRALSREVFLGLMAGVMLFLVSDSLIGLSKFRSGTLELPAIQVWIMATYLIGQLLIVANTLKGIDDLGQGD